jgi:glycosyltransferase involved in cell wall biosynthesis
VDIVVPVHNESASLDELHRRLERLGLASSLVFVDNASSDDSVARIEAFAGVRLIRHARNLGYGASIRDGLLASRAARVVVLDADLEYPPEAVPELLRALDQHAVVYASRFLGGSPPEMPWARRLGNRVISGVFNLLFTQRTTDFYTGMKALRREAIDSLALSQDGFEHVVELGAQLARLGHVIHEVPVTYTARTRGRSKMRHVPEVAKYVWYVTLYWLRHVVLRRPIRPAR